MTEKYMEAKEETAKLHEKLEAQTKEMQQYKEVWRMLQVPGTSFSCFAAPGRCTC